MEVFGDIIGEVGCVIQQTLEREMIHHTYTDNHTKKRNRLCTGNEMPNERRKERERETPSAI